MMPAVTDRSIIGGGVRAMARGYIVLGMAAAFFAMYALTLDPAAFQQLQLQLIDASGLQTDCDVTAAEALAIRADAVKVLIFGTAQAMLAMAAIPTSRVMFVPAQFVSVRMALTLSQRLGDVLAAVADLAIGHCDGIYRQVLVSSHVGVALSLGLLFIHGLIAIFSKVDGRRLAA